MEKQLLELGASALRKAALSEDAKSYILNNPILFKTIKKAADRFIGGETLLETIPKVILQNQNEMKCSIEYMGENVIDVQEVNDATIEFLKICESIHQEELHATISLDLSHIGLAISKKICFENISTICKKAQKNNTEVIISAEGTKSTDSIIQIYKELSKSFDNISITLQAYLYRSKDDFQELIKENGRIRMVKGAFETEKYLSIPRGKKLDDVYLNYVDQLLAINHKCSIATHHDHIQQETKKLIQKYDSSKDVYEFESLFGIQTEQLLALKDEGFSTKIYFVYGKEWYLYLCNRLAEYPLNLFRALNDMVD